MDTSKIKNLILIILLLVNGVFLAILLSDAAESRRVKQQTADSVTAVLAENGIALTAAADLTADSPPQITLERDLEREKKAIEGLLGPTTVESRGGNTYAYYGEKGQALLRGTGEFELLLNAGEVDAGRSVEQTARSVLRKLGMEPTPEALTVQRDESDLVTVTACCAREDCRVFNARVSLLFSQDSLILILGQRLFDAESARSAQTGLDVPTVLLRFLELARREGYVCSEIQALEPGYLVSAQLSGAGSLRPVWRIQTDTGEYFLSGLTGNEELITE